MVYYCFNHIKTNTCHKTPWHQWEFQDPKVEVLYHIRQYFVGISPYIGLICSIYDRYLHFRVLKFPLISGCFASVFSDPPPFSHHWRTAPGYMVPVVGKLLQCGDCILQGEERSVLELMDFWTIYIYIYIYPTIDHNIKNYGEHISHISEWKISQHIWTIHQKLWEIRFKISSDLELDVDAKDLIQWGTQARSTLWRPTVFVTKNAGVRWSGRCWNNRFFNPLFTGKLGIIRHFLVKAKALNMKKFGGWSWSKQQRLGNWTMNHAV